MGTHLLIAEEQKIEATVSRAGPFVLPSFQAPLSPNLFSDCLLERTGSERRLRRGSLLFSVSMQCLVLGILILIPLIYTDVLPLGQLISNTMIAPPPPPPAPAAPRPTHISSNLANGQLIAPTAIPTKIKMIHEEEAPPSGDGVIGGVLGGVPGGQLGGAMGGVLGGIISTHPPVVPAVVPGRVQVSQGISEDMLLTRVEPEYPRIARLGHVAGTVMLRAIISKEGVIENLHALSGNPGLIESAMAAVRQWRYKPYLLNGTPVEIETTVTVNFHLDVQ